MRVVRYMRVLKWSPSNILNDAFDKEIFPKYSSISGPLCKLMGKQGNGEVKHKSIAMNLRAESGPKVETHGKTNYTSREKLKIELKIKLQVCIYLFYDDYFKSILIQIASNTYFIILQLIVSFEWASKSKFNAKLTVEQRKEQRNWCWRLFQQLISYRDKTNDTIAGKLFPSPFTKSYRGSVSCRDILIDRPHKMSNICIATWEAR